MAHEEEVPSIRPPESVVITVLRCKNLKGSKGDSLNSLVRVEFGATLLGESSKVEANIETHTTEYNFSPSFDCTFEDTSCLDAISYKPVTATVIEVLPKDKKGREEKTNVLGQSCIDLIPLLRGETKFSVVQGVHPLTPPTEATIVEHVLPEIEVHVSVSQSLLTETQLNSSNLLSVHVNSVYSVPEAWQVQMAQQFNYTVSLPVPLSKEKENTIVLPNGTLRAPGEKEASNQRKWSSAPSASGSCLYIPDSTMEEVSFEDEDGDLRDKEDFAFRQEAMEEKNHVTWNTERRCFLSAEAAESLQNKIAQNRYWPVEIVRTPIQQATKAKGKQAAVEEDVSISYHGVAYVNMAPLLYPGVRRIRGAYLVKPFMESEVYEKTKRKGTLAEEAVRVVSGMNRALASAMAQKAPPPSKQGKADAKTKPPGPVLKPSDATAAEGESNEVKNLEGLQYLESRTFITLEFVLDNPLVPKRPPSSLARKVAEYIPPRPVFARKPGGSKKAVEDFHTQLTTVANSLLEEFRQMYGDDLMKGNLPLSNDAMDQRRQKFLYELNTSGKYFAFKEQLKNSVIKIVREKYLNTTAFVDKEKLQAFLSELYVFLIDQMHAALNKFLSSEETPEEPPPVTDSATLKHFAREAEVNQNFELAAKYYQERLSRSKNDPDHWFDYGTFCLLIGDYGKAEECFKETLSIAQKHVPGLLMYGCMALMNERYEEAETFFEAATCTESKSVIAWTMLGLYFDSIQNDIGAERAFLEANRFNVATPPSVALEEKAAVATELEGFVPESGAEDPSGEGAHGTGTIEAPRLPEVYADHRRREEAAPIGATLPPSVVISSETPVGKPIIKTVPQSSKHGSRVPSPGSAQRQSPTQELEQTVPPKEKPALVKPNASIFLQTANFLLEVNALQLTDAALAHELVASNGSPGGDYYVLLGRLKIQQKNFIEAEENLKQAIAVKHENPDAWGLMGHLNYLTSKTEEARECYERTLDYTTEASDMHAIYLRLASIYLEQGEFEKAKATFLKACIRSPSCVSWLGVGIACYRLGDLAEAEDALSEANILNNKDAETGRQLEAEQSYKYALKLNLQDEKLLAEIHQTQQRVGFGNPMVA
ncbi:cilia- and flagella-associated protein 70-like isoform X2 [Acropora palmata]|uniref:cilia- and flagella-associated protein 70-like isoform X2 n=1 Tax=Acropora palmata TaxID=6131 RepID=UPI003DA0317A